MRVQIYIIATLLSVMMWRLSFEESRDVYHDAERQGIFPNLHIESTLDQLL